MPNDEDDYGRRRAADYEYALGGNTPGGPPPPTPMEKLLLAAGMPQKEVGETADGIVKLMDRMKDDLPEKQRQMVETFMGAAGRRSPATVDIVTDMALEIVKAKHEHDAPGQKAPAHAAQAPAVHAAQVDNHPRPPEPRIGVGKA